MGRITSNVGLITGLPITETVNQLMEVAGAPRNLLNARNRGLQSQQFAVNALSSRLLSFDFAVNKLKSSTVFQAREATSSLPDTLAANIPTDTTPPVGSYLVQPLRNANAQQLISNRFEDLDAELGGGSFSFRTGGFLDKGISLESLNGGAGIQRGQIKVTDRNGETAVIDLSFAQTVDDVLQTINNEAELSITASVSGDQLVLTDTSGGSGTLTVQEVAGGSTAADLGLGSISVAADSATGSDVFSLHAGSKLTELNDNNGVRFSADEIDDLQINLSDGSATIGIDLAGASTLGEVVTLINEASPGNLSASISADGNRLELADLTSGGGTFSVASGTSSNAAEDLGIAESISGATITGTRITSGLRGTLLSSLNGGQGLGTLGELSLTDRSGASDTVDLSTAETLEQVVDSINAAGVGITASINAARNGIAIADTTGGVGNLTITNNDATTTAEAFAIAVDDAVDSVNSGTLNRQTLSEATLLSTLNGGQGVTIGDVRVTDSQGVSKAADLNATGAEINTVGDVIDAINALGNGVTARINDTGDGIVVIDTAGGTSSLGISDISGNLAESLNLTRASEVIDLEGTDTQVIDGTSISTVDVSDLASSGDSVTLASLNSGAGVSRGAFVINDSDGGNGIVIDLDGAEAGVTTVSQLIDAINDKATTLGVSVTAAVNDAGTGIKLTENAGGDGELTVAAVGDSTVVADLKLDATVTTSGGEQTINGAGTFTSGSTAQSGLAALAERINELDAGVTASTIFDGVGYRLSLVADETGVANELLVDAGLTDFEFTEIAAAQDALLGYGDFGVPGAGVLIGSSTNEFKQVIGGLDLTVQAASDTPVTINVTASDTEVVDAVQDFVDAYNSVRSDLAQYTDFNEDDLSTGILFGTNEALQVDSLLSNTLTNRFFGVGEFQSLEEVGVSVNDDGTLSLDSEKLQEAFRDDPSSLQTLFGDEELGVAAKLNTAIDRLAGEDNSLLSRRNDSLQNTIDSNNTRLEQYDDTLSRQRERLLLEFFQLEQIISNLQQNQSALASLQPIAPL